MKVLSFFSRFTFICNIAFLFFVFFRWLEMRKPVTERNEVLGSVPFLKNLIVTLGFTAIAINIAMHIVYVIFMFSGKLKRVPGWLILANFLFLVLQVYYFFFYKSYNPS